MKQYEITQQAVETVTYQYDELRRQDVGHREALDFIVLEHGVLRAELAAIINDHLAGLHGRSGETAAGSVPPAGLHKPCHGGYPGKVTTDLRIPEDWE